jgi:hypothetical protein
MCAKLTPIDGLTDKRTELLKVIAADLADQEFARSQLNAHLYYEDVGHLIDEEDDTEEDTIQTTTGLLNNIVEEDYYLRKTQQGGDTSFILDTEASEEDGETVTAVKPSEIAEVVDQVAERHGISIHIPEDELPKWNVVCRKVNDAVGHQVLRIASTPNKYELREEGRKLIENELL